MLFARTVSGLTRVTFYQVTRSTTRTCEVREIKKEIKSQLHDEQEVTPVKDAFISKPFRRKIETTGCIKIEDGLFAWPWDGNSQWQTTIIFV